MNRVARRDGFALPLTLFLISIVTLMLTAAFTKVQSDRRVADSSGANITALALAKAGLHQYLGTRPYNSPGTPTAPWRPPDGDSIRINISGGYADVVAKVVRRPADSLANWMYIVRATGHVIDPVQGSDPQALRTIAQFAQWQTGRMDAKAAYYSVDGLNGKTGATDRTSIIGTDFGTCGAAPIYAIRTKNSGDPGLPSTSASPVLATESANTLIDSTNLDWNAILNGGFTPDYTSYQAGDNTYSSQFINGNLTVSNLNGTGLLIVKNDLTLQGLNATWNGIILVGGKVNFDAGTKIIGLWFGQTTINGMVVSGMNNGGGKADIGDHPVVIQYNSCQIRSALARLTGFAPITNAWVDNWAMY